MLKNLPEKKTLKTNQTRLEMLREIRRVIHMHRIMGITSYEKNTSLKEFLLPKIQSTEAKATPGQFLPKQTVEIESPATVPNIHDNRLLDDIHKEATQCSLCSLHTTRQGTVHGLGKIGARLMLVGDWSLQPEKPFSQAQLFGSKEDEMLWKMMKAIGLTSKDIYLTNCLKCCPPTNSAPKKGEEQTCFSYLKREITLLNPTVICAMGTMAAHILLGKNDPLVRLRGRFYPSRQMSKSTVVMPTFHPRFLLQHPEMKRAVWMDLQLIQQRLTKQSLS